MFDTLGAFELDCLIVSAERDCRQSIPSCVDEGRIFVATADQLKRISTLSTPPSIIAVFKIPDDDNESLSLPSESLSLLIDGIQDPGNLGTIIRTADWFGFDKVFLSTDSVDVYNPKTIQATMGSLRRVKVVYANLEKLLREGNVKNIYGTLLEGGENIYKVKLSDSGAIIMGSEGSGISSEIRKLISRPLFIPPYNRSCHGESLNVAIATAITLSIFRNR